MTYRLHGKILASNPHHVEILAFDITRLHDHERRRLAVFLHSTGLMVDKSWFRRFLLQIAAKRHGPIAVTRFFECLPDSAMESYIMDVYNHMRYGKDTEDTDSVGGYSQREINLITEQL